MNSRLRERAINLRIEKELSYAEIRKRLGVPKSTLSYWLREFPLSEERISELRRQGWKRGEASRERFRLAMRKKKELKDKEVYKKYQKRFATLSKDAFFIAGLMFYSAEGEKRNPYKLSFANTNPKIIKFFIRWLNECLAVPKERIKATLHLYENMDIEKEKEFWKNELGFQENQFYKPSIRKLRKSSFSYRESYRHGTCNIYIGGSEERNREVMMAIQAFLDKFEGA
jgi:transposase-like protein